MYVGMSVIFFNIQHLKKMLSDIYNCFDGNVFVLYRNFQTKNFPSSISQFYAIHNTISGL